MKRLVSPAVDQLKKLRQPLTRGELLVFEIFDKYLSPEWEIYIQPHLNGLRPDFVLLNPNSGLGIFEVKDWDLDAMEYYTEYRHGGSPKLCGIKDGKKFSLQGQNPVDKIQLYNKEIFDIYCPRLNNNMGYVVISTGIIFPFAAESRVYDLLRASLDYYKKTNSIYNPVSGRESILSGDIRKIFPEGGRRSSKYINSNLAKDLRNWLIEPDFAATQRTPLEIDKNQIKYVTSRTPNGLRRLKGPAGSGKSIVLAARAAELIGQGKYVLVVTFNITLLHYLMDIAVRWPNSNRKTRENAVWINFHHLCKRVCQITGHVEEYNMIWRDFFNSADEETSIAYGGRLDNQKDHPDFVLRQTIPELVLGILINENANKTEAFDTYDAILVDEGQDFLPLWWNVLRQLLRPNGEMLLVADKTQDVYGTATAWTDEVMKGSGFIGPWAEFIISYRLPPVVIKYVREFAQEYLPPDKIDLPISFQDELNLFPCKLKWVQTDTESAVSVCVKEILTMAIQVEPQILAIPDIVFLTPSAKIGRDVTCKLQEKNVKTINTFDPDSRASKRQKMGFYMGDARIKATTLHSFKGWESRALVIFIGSSLDEKSLALIYTGLTRLKRHVDWSFLTVISCVNKLDVFGATWPEYEKVKENRIVKNISKSPL